MLETDDDLPTLIRRKDHLNVLRYLRVHQIRDPALVVTTGTAWLGDNLDRSMNKNNNNTLVRLAALEQICLAALEIDKPQLADLCLKRLQEAGVAPESSRFRLLQGHCLEAVKDYTGAELLYNDLLEENPANLLALKRKYCIFKAQVGKQAQAVEALNAYLQQNFADTAAWYELVHLRQEMGDYQGAVFCLEQVLLAVPADAKIHVQLAECLATSTVAVADDKTRLDHLHRARQHMAQALELDPHDRRAQLGLVSVANSYLVAAAAAKKEVDEHEIKVAQELVRYGAEQVLEAYMGSNFFSRAQKLMAEYTDNL